MNAPLFIVDPTEHFASKNVSQQKLIQACGLLPHFCIGDAPTIEENLRTNYQFFMGWSVPGDSPKVDEQGVFHYTGDEPQYPLLKVQGGNETIYIYQYAIVAHVVDGQLVGWTRMD